MYLLILFVSIFNPEGKIKSPPGTVRIEDNFFVDQYEITNVDWNQFRYYSWKDTAKDENGYHILANSNLPPRI